MTVKRVHTNKLKISNPAVLRGLPVVGGVYRLGKMVGETQDMSYRVKVTRITDDLIEYEVLGPRVRKMRVAHAWFSNNMEKFEDTVTVDAEVWKSVKFFIESLALSAHQGPQNIVGLADAQNIVDKLAAAMKKAVK